MGIIGIIGIGAAVHGAVRVGLGLLLTAGLLLLYIVGVILHIGLVFALAGLVVGDWLTLIVGAAAAMIGHGMTEFLPLIAPSVGAWVRAF